MRIKNIDAQTRIYNDLQRDGRTLELGPGEEADVDVPEALVQGLKDDPFVKIVEAPVVQRVRSKPVEQEQVSA